MEDKWKQKFKEKLDGYQSDVQIPLFLPLKKHHSFVYWLMGAAAAAIVTLLLWLYPRQERHPDSVALHSIHEAVAEVRMNPYQFVIADFNLPDRTHIKIETEKDQIRTVPPPQGQKQEPTTPPTAPGQETPSENDTHTDTDSESIQSKQIIPSPSSPAGHRHWSMKVQGVPRLAGIFQEQRFERKPGAAVFMDSLYSFVPPVKAGISFMFPISQNWSVESGLNYSHHVVKWQARADYEPFSESIFHQYFLGIPVRINYRILDYQQLSLYGAIGGELSIRLAANNQEIHYGTALPNRKLYGHPLLFSLTAGAGVDFRFTSWLGLYAEPGIAWYLNEIRDIPDYHWRRPLSFEITVGLRFSL